MVQEQDIRKDRSPYDTVEGYFKEIIPQVDDDPNTKRKLLKDLTLVSMERGSDPKGNNCYYQVKVESSKQLTETGKNLVFSFTIREDGLSSGDTPNPTPVIDWFDKIMTEGKCTKPPASISIAR